MHNQLYRASGFVENHKLNYSLINHIPFCSLGIKKIGLFFGILLMITATTEDLKAQSPGPNYRQFFFNPYLFNPAYVAINNSVEASVVYRQQWTNFKDAPVTMGANIQFPTNERVSLGFNVFTDKQVLVRNSNVTATFGYVVPIAENQALRFGLSGGIGLNKLDLSAEELNSNDPALMNASGNNYYVDGNFGIAYTNGGFRLGFALTDLFKSSSFNTESFNEFKLSNLKNRLYSVSYKFNMGVMQNVALEPYFLYRQSVDGLQDFWEAGSVVYLKQNFWTGASYNQNNGMALFLGMNIKEKLRFSYSYEFPPSTTRFTSTSAHEIHLGVRLAGKKTTSVSKPAREVSREIANTDNDEPIKSVGEDSELAQNEETEERNKNPEAISNDSKKGRLVTGENSDDIHKESFKPTNDDLIKEEKAKTPPTKTFESFTMTKNHHYVVVGVFSVLNHALRFSKDMMSDGYPASISLNPHNNLYYVYIYSSKEVDDSKKFRNEFKRRNLFKDVWIFYME